MFDSAKKVHRSWARTPLWKRAEYLHKVDALLKDNVEPMANALVKEIAKPKKDAKTEVVRSGDLIAYTAEEGVRFLGQGKLLNSDSFPGQERSKMCLCQKVSWQTYTQCFQTVHVLKRKLADIVLLTAATLHLELPGRT